MIELHPEFLIKNGKKEFAVLTYEEFMKIKEILEDLEDLEDLIQAKEEEKDSQTYSLDEVKKMLNIDWRKWFDRMQPQTLQIAAMLLYLNGFFALIRSTSVNSLYSNELAYQHFGYEGASFPKGGYLMRGFNDLKWLPAAPAEASPSAFS